MPVLIILLCLIFLLAALLILRALAYGAKSGVRAEAPQLTKAPDAAKNLAQMLKIKTVSSYNQAEMDEAEFERFRALLCRLYPKTHISCPPVRIGHTGLLYKYPGKSGAEPTVLMAHYDVVPADDEGWEHPPFCGEIFGNELWGRGALDTKITVLSIMEAAEAALSAGLVPQNDIYISFCGDEEVSGESAPAVVDYLQANNIKPALVLDEGGAIVQGAFPGVNAPIAVIGVAEKGMMNVRLTAEASGGHASTPVHPSALVRLGRAAQRIEKHGFKPQITRPVYELLRSVGPHAPLSLRVVLSNLWLFSPIIKLLSGKLGGELSAMLCTTTAFTTASGSPQINVLAQKASLGLNIRLISSDTPEAAQKRLEQLCRADNVKVTVTHSQKASPCADTSGKQWQAVAQAVGEVWPNAIVSPYLMVACSDSRHFSRICQNVYKFSAMELSKEQRGYIHNTNERIPLDCIDKCVEFYKKLINNL